MVSPRSLRGGAVFVLPNMITTGNLFWGFFSVIKSLQGQFIWAAYALILAAIFDMLDGRVARLTGASSEFGVQYDSLCDAVSFGLAPAFMVYQYGLNTFGRVGWILCFIFLACGVLRLARFNVLSSIGKTSGDFAGLPIPMAALTLASVMLFFGELDSSQDKAWLNFLIPLFSQPVRLYFFGTLTVCLGLLMVSTVVFRSHKSIKFRGIKPFQLLVVLVGFVGLFAYQPEVFGCLLVLLYMLSGPFEWLLGWKKPVDEYEIFEAHQDAEGFSSLDETKKNFPSREELQ